MLRVGDPVRLTKLPPVPSSVGVTLPLVVGEVGRAYEFYPGEDLIAVEFKSGIIILAPDCYERISL